MSRFPDAERGVRAACEMHQAIKDDADLSELNIAIKIGLHYGSVLVEAGDLFGDAVNIAARMVSQAKADQIITTRDTVGFLSGAFEQMTRSLGWSRVRGKQDEMEILEVLWQDEAVSLTHMVSNGQQDAIRNLLLARLALDYRGNRFEVIPDSQPFTLGRGRKSHLVIEGDLVSRSHADIEFRQGKFVLVDHSTNGTYLLLENGARFFVRREEFTLHEQGTISLGQAVSEQDPDIIRYECTYA